MTVQCKGKKIKRDQKINITAAYGAELVLEGATSIPNIMLRFYKALGITDLQMMLLIQLIRFISEEGEYFPTPEMLSECMGAEAEQIRHELTDLIDNDTINITEFFDSTRQKTVPGFDFEPLFLKISDIWAGNRLHEIEEAEKLKRIAVDGLDFDDKPFEEKTQRLLAMFADEFGKALSSIEINQIEKWVADRGVQLVEEALKEAVLRGKYNFKYIDSILMGWKKNNINTLEGVAEFEQQFKSRRSGQIQQKRRSGGVNVDKSENDKNSRKKEFIRSLYV